jgi:hypothetical protein
MNLTSKNNTKQPLMFKTAQRVHNAIIWGNFNIPEPEQKGRRKIKRDTKRKKRNHICIRHEPILKRL